MPRSSRPNVVDSSAWLAWFADEPGADHFADPIEDTASLGVPAICLVEVFKVIARQRDEGAALQAVALMQQGRIVDLDATLALAAAKAGIDYKLPLAESIVYATAGQVDGVVWTRDDDFDGLGDVRFFPKQKPAR